MFTEYENIRYIKNLSNSLISSQKNIVLKNSFPYSYIHWLGLWVIFPSCWLVGILCRLVQVGGRGKDSLAKWDEGRRRQFSQIEKHSHLAFFPKLPSTRKWYSRYDFFIWENLDIERRYFSLHHTGRAVIFFLLRRTYKGNRSGGDQKKEKNFLWLCSFPSCHFFGFLTVKRRRRDTKSPRLWRWARNNVFSSLFSLDSSSFWGRGKLVAQKRRFWRNCGEFFSRWG